MSYYYTYYTTYLVINSPIKCLTQYNKISLLYITPSTQNICFTIQHLYCIIHIIKTNTSEYIFYIKLVGKYETYFIYCSITCVLTIAISKADVRVCFYIDLYLTLVATGLNVVFPHL